MSWGKEAIKETAKRRKNISRNPILVSAAYSRRNKALLKK